MITRELYIKVLEYMQDRNHYSCNPKIVEEKDFCIIGDIIIKSVLESISEVEETQIKNIVCNYVGYSQEQYTKTTYDDLCLLVSEKVVKFKSYPADKYQELLQKYYEVKTRYSTVISDIENKVITIDSRIKVDNEHPQLCGTLIQQQQRLRCSSEANKSLLKDLKQIETKYYALIDEIQENYIYQEMLNYAKNKIEEYLGATILKMSEEDATEELIKMAIEMSKEDSSDLGELSVYDNCLKSWENATQSIYKPFYMIKMRKFIYDIECFCDSSYNGEYEFANVIEQRDVLRDYLTSEDFWDYVLNYIKEYDEQEIPDIKLKAIFKSRVRALQSYIAKNKGETLPIVVEVSKALESII